MDLVVRTRELAGRCVLEADDLRGWIVPERGEVRAGALVAGDQPVPVGIDIHADVLAEHPEVGMVRADERTPEQPAGVLAEHRLDRHRLAGDLDV